MHPKDSIKIKVVSTRVMYKRAVILKYSNSLQIRPNNSTSPMTAVVHQKKNQLSISGCKVVVYKKKLNVELVCVWLALSAISSQILAITFVQTTLIKNF